MDSIAYDYEYDSARKRLRPAEGKSIRSSAASDRSAALRRALLLADVIAALIGGFVASVAFAHPARLGAGPDRCDRPGLGGDRLLLRPL